MGRRTILLIAALVIAALGTTGVFLYVKGVDQRAEAGLDMVEVLVASQPIEVATTARAASRNGAIERREFLRKSVQGLPVMTNLEGIANQVALVKIVPGEPILRTAFGAPSEAARLPIPRSKIAVSIRMDGVGRVAGFVGPGSKAALFLTSTATAGSQAGQQSTCVLLPMVDIVAADQATVESTSSGTDEQTDGSSDAVLTVAVSQSDAQKIFYAENVGTLTFGLRTGESIISRPGACVTEQNLFD